MNNNEDKDLITDQSQINQSTFTQLNSGGMEGMIKVGSLATQLVENVKGNRTIIGNLKKDLIKFKEVLESEQKNELSFSKNFCSPKESLLDENNNDPKFKPEEQEESSKMSLIVKKYQTRIDELEAQLLDQDDLIQEHERSTQTLMSSFRERYSRLLNESHLLRGNYEHIVEEERTMNLQLAQENMKLRTLLEKLLFTIKSEILDHMDDDELAYKENLTGLEIENNNLRALLEIANIPLSDFLN